MTVQPTHDNHESSLHDAEVAALRQELEALRAEFAAFRAAVSPIMEQMHPPVTPPAATSEPAADDHEQGQSIAIASRRDLLKWGGLGAAAALAATGSAALSTPTAHANTGDLMVVGSTGNSAANNTKLTLNTTSAGLYGLIVDAELSPNSIGLWAISGDGGVGVKGWVQGNGGIGLRGEIYGAGGYGVVGLCNSGTGVYGSSNTGVSILAGGSGRIFQNANTLSGPPTSGSFSLGEQIRDFNGDMFICITGGSPGTWRKVAAGVPGMSGAINFLANPIRLLDTRTSSPWIAGSTHTLQVTGVSVGSIEVPAGAVGVVGNVTVVRPTDGGDLRLYPGASAPATSSINFASGQIIANGVIVGLNSSGKLNIKVDMPTGATANVLFDVSGFIL